MKHWRAEPVTLALLHQDSRNVRSGKEKYRIYKVTLTKIHLKNVHNKDANYNDIYIIVHTNVR